MLILMLSIWLLAVGCTGSDNGMEKDPIPESGVTMLPALKSIVPTAKPVETSAPVSGEAAADSGNALIVQFAVDEAPEIISTATTPGRDTWLTVTETPTTARIATTEPTVTNAAASSKITALPPKATSAAPDIEQTASPLDTRESPAPTASMPDQESALPSLVTATSLPDHESEVTPPANATAGHFSACATRTGANATIAVPADVAINGTLVLEVDDEIAIFTPDESICAGMTPWSGSNIAITAWGDDSQTPEVDGLLEGEKMVFQIWDRSENKEITVKKVTYSLGDGIYTTDGIYAVEAFSLE